MLAIDARPMPTRLVTCPELPIMEISMGKQTGEQQDIAGGGLDAEEGVGRRGDSRNGALVAGFLIGAVFGAGVALLLAPDTGRETRRQLLRRIRAMRKDAARGLEQAEAHARRRLRRGRRGLRERWRS